MTKKKPRMGRPPTDPTTHHSEAVIVRLTVAQREAIDAARGTVTIGVWIRERALASAHQMPVLRPAISPVR